MTIRASNGQVYTYTPPHPAELSLTDWLDQELAAEEHEQGVAYGQDREHCGTCALVARSHLQSRCAHENVDRVNLARLDHGIRWLESCRDCGLDLRDVSESSAW